MPSNEMLAAICEIECMLYEEAGYYASIYASKSWFDTKLNSPVLDRFDKWIAWWYDGASSSINRDIYGMWQYTSSGVVDGINGKADLDESFKNYPQIIRGLRKSFEDGQEYEALAFLVEKGRINDMEYWLKALDVVKNLKWLIIKWANDLL